MLRPEGYAGQAGGFMNTLILNRAYALPEDGWYHIAPLGEFPHAGASITQVIDQEACIAMAARFAADANTPNFPGLLIDFDHFAALNGANVIAMAVNELSQILLGQADGTAALSYGAKFGLGFYYGNQMLGKALEQPRTVSPEIVRPEVIQASGQ
jgi:hypothetical protein